MIRLFRSLATTAVMTSVSRVLGYARDAVIFIFISNAHGALDAFFVAFRIPNFLRRLSAEGAFSQAFVPVFTEYREKRPEELQSLIDATAGALAMILLVITVTGILIAPILILIFAPGFSFNGDARADIATDLLRITFPYALFISLTAMAWSMQKALLRPVRSANRCSRRETSSGRRSETAPIGSSCDRCERRVFHTGSSRAGRPGVHDIIAR